MKKQAPKEFPALEQVTSPVVDTATAAYYLNRKPQTLNKWAFTEKGPIQPVRINSRLAWPVDEIRRVTGAQNQASD